MVLKEKKNKIDKKDFLNNEFFMIYNLLLGFLIKDGKKIKALKILNKVFFLVRKNLKISEREILSHLFQNLGLSIELRKVHLFGKTHYVPSPITLKRKIYLVVKILISSALKRSKKLPFYENLSDEIISTVEKKPCDSLKTVLEIMKLALKNRSNIHFRW